MQIKLVSLIIIFFLSFFLNVNAQNKAVLFTLNNNPVYKSEFIRVYKKNLDLVKDESQKNIDSYLKLFINYKLKLEEAKTLGLDKKPSYLRDFNSYKKQLSENYLKESKVTNQLVEEAYGRILEEVNASHVLIKLNENALPKDTLIAYNTILKLRDRVVNEGFKAVQKSVHNGNKIFAEDLGYFSAFKMIYSFENVAYKTKVGDISMPFRTRFGYHIITVLDKRKSQGEISTAHIMILEDESKINDIYKRLEQGEQFQALAKQFSEDKSSASKGGVLKPFVSGELSSVEFEKQALALNTKNSYSKPFKSKFGWHIVMLINKKPIQPLNEIRAQLESDIKRDSRSKMINNSRINKLKAKYKIKENSKALDYFESIINEQYSIGKWSVPSDFKSNEIIFSIENKTYNYKGFAEFLIKNQYPNRDIESKKIIINKTYKKYLEAELLKFQEDNLLNENQEYAQIIQEYKDGLLLFDLMEDKIWNVAKNDSIGVHNYYKSNTQKYVLNERVDAIVASSAKKKSIKKVAKLLNKGDSKESIKTILNTKDKINVSFTEGQMEASHQALPANFSFVKGVSSIYKHNDAFVVVKVNKILPKQEKTFKQVKGQVINDFQIKTEKEWLKTLASKYKLVLNKNVLKRVKLEIKNQ